jgi:chromosome partitioning protein
VAKNLREHFPHRVFAVQVPRSVALAEAPSYSKPVLLYRPDSSGADAYRRLAEEVIADEITSAVPEGAAASENFGDFNITS